MIGERIHSYEINAHLGSGGMGEVFRAVDTNLGREVALKMLRPQLTVQPQFLERFKKEARILAQLLHPNIAVIYNFIEHGGNHFMVMEYVKGHSLDDLLKKYEVLPAGFVVPVFIQALEGLQHAHRKNIFHRDIKPANLMITEDSTLKLMDFGIAKVSGEQKMTQVNRIVGTIEFMAPELIEGKDASSASDIYAMGATLYELVSGKIPFEGDTDFNIMQSILKSKIKPPEKLNAAVPKALSDIILKAMSRNPEQRYPNARAFQMALVTSFPNYKEINVDALRKPQQNVNATQVTRKPSPASTTFVDTSSVKKIVETVKPLVSLQLYRNKILSNKKLSLIIAFSLLAVISIFAIVATRSDNPDQANIAKNDSTIQAIKSAGTVVKKDPVVTSLQENNSLPQPDNRIPVTDEYGDDKNEIPIANEKLDRRIKDLNAVADEKPRKALKNAKETTIEKTVDNKETELPPVIKPAEKKEIYINSEVTVTLSLIGTPDMNQKKKTEQAVTFTVIRPVFYEGVLIIRQGARASGSLTIGRVRTDVEINRVEGANGMSISLKTERSHGRRDDIESHNTFNAIIQKGTRMNF
ncbi:MAG: serine/threonine-protein kinase [Chitinophagaceae bacterium]